MLLLFVAPVLAQDTQAASDNAADASAAAPVDQAVAKPAKKAKAKKSGGDEKGIKKTFTQVSEAWASGDAKALASHFTPDSSLINPMGMEGNGRAEVEKVIEAEMAGPMKGTQQTFDDFNFTWVMPNFALVDCTGTVTGMKNADGTDAEPLKVHVYGVIVNRGHGWQARAIRAYAFLKPPAAVSDASAAPAVDSAAAASTPSADDPAAPSKDAGNK